MNASLVHFCYIIFVTWHKTWRNRNKNDQNLHLEHNLKYFKSNKNITIDKAPYFSIMMKIIRVYEWIKNISILLPVECSRQQKWWIEVIISFADTKARIYSLWHTITKWPTRYRFWHLIGSLKSECCHLINIKYYQISLWEKGITKRNKIMDICLETSIYIQIK